MGKAKEEAKKKAMIQQQINREVAIKEAEEKATRLKLKASEKARLKKAKAEIREAKYGGAKKVLLGLRDNLKKVKTKGVKNPYSMGRSNTFETGSGNINFGGKNVFSGNDTKVDKKPAKKIIIKLE